MYTPSQTEHHCQWTFEMSIDIPSNVECLAIVELDSKNFEVCQLRDGAWRRMHFILFQIAPGWWPAFFFKWKHTAFNPRPYLDGGHLLYSDTYSWIQFVKMFLAINQYQQVLSQEDYFYILYIGPS